jgi:anaerobic selenocysteine-containing dehydrogenase
MMNPADIQRLALGENQTVTMRSPTGRMERLEVYPFDVPEGNVLAYYPEANILTSGRSDPRSKTPAFKSVGVGIFKDA